MDLRAPAEVEWLKGEIGEQRIFASSAYRLEDHPNMVNLFWEKRNRSCLRHAVAAGLAALPFLMGERSPIWDANARGAIFGLSLNHTKGQLVRALMEGVAYAMDHNFTFVHEAGLPTNLPLILNEGGAVSRLW